MREKEYNSPFIDCLCACEVTEAFLEKCVEAGVAGINKCICTDESMYPAVKSICGYREFIEQHEDLALLVREPEDIERAYSEHKVGIMMGFQNTIPLEFDLRLVDIYAESGVSIIQLTYNYLNLVGVGVMEEKPGGLSEFGRSAVKKLNKAKVLIDLSHGSEPTVLDALACSEVPLMISHANCKAVHNTPRNVSDEVLKAINKNGGIIGCAAFSAFIKKGMVQNDLDEMIDHIDHMVEVAGIDHVVIGGDQTEGRSEEEFIAFNYKPDVIPEWPWPYTKGFEATYKVRNLEEALKGRGYSDDDIKKIFYENFMRVFREVRR